MAVLFATDDDSGSTLPVNGTDIRFLGDTTQFGAVNVHLGNTAERIDAGTPVNLEYDLADLSYTLNGTLVEIRDRSDDLVASIQAETSTDTTIAGLDGAADIVADMNGNVTVGGAAVTSEPTSGNAVNRDPGGRPGPPEVTDVGVRGDALTFEVDQVGKASITGASEPANKDIQVDMFGEAQFTPVPEERATRGVDAGKLAVTDGSGETGKYVGKVILGSKRDDSSDIDGSTRFEDDVVFAFAGNDGDETISLRDGDDIFLGGKGDDAFIRDVNGNRGADILRGGDGDDGPLRGREGKDTLFGGPGNDELWGGPGGDTLHGGPGADIIETGRSTDTAQDTIVIENLDDVASSDVAQKIEEADEYRNFKNQDLVDLPALSLVADDGTVIGSAIESGNIANHDLDGESVDLTDTSHAIFHDTALDEGDFDSNDNVQGYADDLEGDETVSANTNLDALLFVEDSNANDVALFRLDNSGNDTELEASEVRLLAVFQDTGGLNNVDGDNLI